MTVESKRSETVSDLGFKNEFEFTDETKPHLKPQDLEDIAAIFDKIRALYKKKEEPVGSAKLIKKRTTQDNLATEFDKKLTDIMYNLSKHLKDNILSDS